jgi:transcriptional regulator with XRE-family HTH domain
MNYPHMHETLKRMRKTCKISQVRIGTILGLNQAGVSRIENGTQQVSIEWLMSLSKLYQVDLESMISGRINYWELARKFNVKVPLPKKYLKDQRALVSEIDPLLNYFRCLYHEDTIHKFLKELGLEDLALIDKSSRVSIHCIYDILNLAIEKKLVSLSEVPKVVDLAFHSFEGLPFHSIYKTFETSPEIIQAWVLNSSAYEGMFTHRVESVYRNEQIISFKVCEELQEADFKKNQVDQFILDYKTQYFEKLPLHFGHKSAGVEVLESPFEQPSRTGLLKLIS